MRYVISGIAIDIYRGKRHFLAVDQCNISTGMEKLYRCIENNGI